MFADIAKCPLESKTAPSWEPELKWSRHFNSVNNGYMPGSVEADSRKNENLCPQELTLNTGFTYNSNGVQFFKQTSLHTQTEDMHTMIDSPTFNIFSLASPHIS